jgi:peptidoglycan-N-acetylglucosamine deacetylase
MVKIPGILKTIFPDITWNIQGDGPSLYLTFDDGPTPAVTEKVLSILKQYHAHATFFCIGRNVERLPEIYHQIILGGHTTGNHTYSHLKGWYTPNDEYFHDIALAAQFIHSALYRPAYGMITLWQKNTLKKHYRIVLWDVMSYDFDYNTSPQQCVRNVIRHARPGSVVVFHDSIKASENVLYALPVILELFSKKGFSFKPIQSRIELTPLIFK